MKTLILLVVMASTAMADCENKLSWRVWRSEFEQVCRKNGFNSEAASHFRLGNPVFGSQHARREEDIREQWCNGHFPQGAFDELGYDSIAFAIVWMPRFNRLRGGANSDESMRPTEEEYLWFKYFLNRKSPEKAVHAERDLARQRRHSGNE